MISIIFPVHNGEEYLAEAIESVISQTDKNWELLLLDDGSTDNSVELLQSLIKQSADSRVVLHQNPANLGLPATLNIGISHARGKFICRFDADDIMLSKRLEIQRKFLDNNPHIGIVGSAAIAIDSCGETLRRITMPATHSEIVCKEFSGLASAFIHPSIMVRRNLFTEFNFRYDESFKTSQDKKLWFEMLQHTQGANISEPLIKYRKHPDSASIAKRSQQQQNATSVCKMWLEALLQEDVSDAETKAFIDTKPKLGPSDSTAIRFTLKVLRHVKDKFGIERSSIRKMKARLLMRIARSGSIGLLMKIALTGFSSKNS